MLATRAAILLVAVLSSCGGAPGFTLHEPASHRASAAVCSVDRTGETPSSVCAPAAGCTGLNAITYCEPDPLSGGSYFSECAVDECGSDADCPAFGGLKAVCACNFGVGPRNSCIYGDCTSDADCGAGKYCSLSDDRCTSAFHCHTAADTCADDSDCPPPIYALCLFDPTVRHWACTNPQCEMN
jgi:hypothetical protein